MQESFAERALFSHLLLVIHSTPAASHDPKSASGRVDANYFSRNAEQEMFHYEERLCKMTVE